MSQHILIAGGSGLVGTRLTALLQAEGHTVAWLSRSEGTGPNGLKKYAWDPEKGTYDPAAFAQVDAVVNLAGAGIADGRWTTRRKQLVLRSRTESTKLLARALVEQDCRPEAYVGASAVGYYGAHRGDELLTESSAPGSDFLAEVVVAWEQAHAALAELTGRHVVLRIGVVLSTQGGALEKISQPIKLCVGAPLGSGKQWVPWVHIDDLAAAIRGGLVGQVPSGTYVAAAPEPASNKALTQAIAKQLGKPLFLPPVPGFVLKAALGKMASVVLGSNRADSSKLQATDFSFNYANLPLAVEHLYEQGV